MGQKHGTPCGSFFLVVVFLVVGGEGFGAGGEDAAFFEGFADDVGVDESGGGGGEVVEVEACGGVVEEDGEDEEHPLGHFLHLCLLLVGGLGLGGGLDLHLEEEDDAEEDGEKVEGGDVGAEEGDGDGGEGEEGVGGGEVGDPAGDEGGVAEVEVVPEALVHGDPDGHLDEHGEAAHDSAGGVDVVFPIDAHGFFLLALLIVGVFLFDGVDFGFDGVHLFGHGGHVDLAGFGERVEDGADEDDEDEDGDAVVAEGDVPGDEVECNKKPDREELEGAVGVEDAAGAGELDDVAVVVEFVVVCGCAERWGVGHEDVTVLGTEVGGDGE